MLDLEEEAKILTQTMLGGRSDQFIEGAQRMLESVVALASESEDGCLLVNDMETFLDYFNYNAEEQIGRYY